MNEQEKLNSLRLKAFHNFSLADSLLLIENLLNHYEHLKFLYSNTSMKMVNKIEYNALEIEHEKLKKEYLKLRECFINLEDIDYDYLDVLQNNLNNPGEYSYITNGLSISKETLFYRDHYIKNLKGEYECYNFDIIKKLKDM